ncbi:MAG: LysM peptidoglycan-binding domain-containing protein [Elusimicrobiota bacterium]
MRFRNSSFILLITFSVLIAGKILVYAAFEDPCSNARVRAMGNAYSAVGDDINSLMLNPAGLGQMHRKEITVFYGQLHTGLTQLGSSIGHGMVSYVQYLEDIGTYGVGWANLGLADAYQENTVILSYGRKLGSSFFAGASLKYLRVDYAQDGYTLRDPVFNSNTRMGAGNVGVDLGILSRMDSNFSFGLSLLDVNQPNIGIIETVGVPLTIRGGVSYRNMIITACADVVVRQGNYQLNAGFENWIGNNFAVRTGLGIGNRDYREVSAGIGYITSLMSFDYAFTYPLAGIQGVMGTHLLSVTLSFGYRLPIEERIKYHFGMASEYIKNQEYELAIVEYRRVLQLDPWNKVAEEGISSAHAKMRESEQFLKEALEKARQSAEDATRAAEEAQRQAEQMGKVKVLQVERPRETDSGPRTYVVRQGDTLQSIAEELYNNPQKWMEIYELNKDKIIKGNITPGDVLILP